MIKLSLKKGLIKLAKAVFLLLLIHLLYRQISAGPSWSDWQAQTHHFGYIILAIALLPINWWLEAHKWRRLLHQNGHKLTLAQAWKAVMAGVALGLITPQRIGLYGGRIMMLPPKLRWPGMLGSIMSNVAQLIVIVGLGLIGLAMAAEPLFTRDFATNGSLVYLAILVNLIMLAGLWWAAKTLPFWPAWLQKRGWALPQSWRPYWQKIPTRGWSEVVVWSLLRYLVYTGQFMLLLRALAPGIPLRESFSGVASIFLLQTGIPLPPVLGLTARNEIALLIWSDYGLDAIGILLATTGLFILNMSLPALWGGVLILTKNLLKNEKTETISTP